VREKSKKLKKYDEVRESEREKEKGEGEQGGEGEADLED
jgi:hypothetical protein